MSYSEEEKIFFVERMWADGLTPTEASRKWGRPSRSCLRAWELEALAGELPAKRYRVVGACKHEKGQRYPSKTKDEAVRRYLAGEKAANIARSMGISDGRIIFSWARSERTLENESFPDVTLAKEEKNSAMTNDKKLKEKIAELEARLEEAEMQAAVLRELMRDPKVDGPESLSNKQKAELGEKLRKEKGISLGHVLTFFSISKSTYEHNRKSLLRKTLRPSSEQIDHLVLKSFEKSAGTYGYRRISSDTGLSQRAVRSSMHRQHLVACNSRRPRHFSSYAGEISDAPPNLLVDSCGHHDFTAPAPNSKWTTDITEMRAKDGKLYLSVIMDLFDGRIVSWRHSKTPNAQLAEATLRDALSSLPKDATPPLIHSDRGIHYRCKRWIELCEKAGLSRSMSKKAYTPDNAAVEGFFGRMKVEIVYRLIDKGATREKLARALEAYLRWYNSGRLKSFSEGKRGEGSKTYYETIDGRRKRLGLAV